MTPGTLTWVQPNADKPHRCPRCHLIAERAWDYRGHGPRTIMYCIAPNCGVRWRVGYRKKREPMRWITAPTIGKKYRKWDDPVYARPWVANGSAPR